MTLNDLYEFTMRNAPAVVGSAIYAFTQLGVVAWLTCIWVSIQIVRFSLDWFRQERVRYLKKITKRGKDREAE